MKLDLHVMYKSRAARRTLDPKYMTPYHVQTQWAEFTKLKEVIGQSYGTSDSVLSVFDIGIGYARVPLWLSQVRTWDKISRYFGIDISDYCVSAARRVANANKLTNKVKVVQFDATNLNVEKPEFPGQEKEKYDLIVCTYFTAGDFKPNQIRLRPRENGAIQDYDADLLKPNKDFVAVFEGAYDLLKHSGKIVIGSVYLDSDLARNVQEEFYAKCGMSVITSRKDQFSATKEGFWSERFSKEKIYDYLSWVPDNRIEIIPLDDYDFAAMVIINR